MKENNIFVIYHTSLHSLMDTFIRADSKEEAALMFEQVRREEKMKLGFYRPLYPERVRPGLQPCIGCLAKILGNSGEHWRIEVLGQRFYALKQNVKFTIWKG